MEWQDEGLILGVRKHGETSAIVELMTLAHGRHLGLVRGGRSRRMRPVLQPGNSIKAVWHARLEDHLGTYSLEPDELRAAQLMASQTAVYGIQLIASHLRLLPERDPHQALYRAARVIVENLEHGDIAASLMIRFELALLEELGFGLDLERCASTGQSKELTYVSPKSGRAVSQEAGEPWADRMLRLPGFLNRYESEWGRVPGSEDLQNGFALSEFFLERHIYSPRGIKPADERTGFIRSVLKQYSGEEQTGSHMQ
ncbi:MAG: DNA repair protein RecO [Pseudomonadota bacterium]